MDFDEFGIAEQFEELFMETAQLVQFSGFNPETFRKVLQKREPDEKLFKKDLVHLITHYVNRGTRLDKTRLRMSDKGVKLTTELVKKYQIQTGQPKSATDVTMARIGASYPIMCARALQMRAGRVVGEHDDLPYYLAFPAGASMIPKGEEKMFLAWKKWRENFTKIIRQGDTTKLRTDDVDYDTIIWNSSLYTEKQRMQIISDLKKSNK